VLTVLLVFHGLVAVALLGALSHQSAALFARQAAANHLLVGRYARVDDRLFARSIIVLYVIVVVLGSVLYPAYRVDVRIPFEELGLFWAVGVFEIKEHAGGIGLGLLPLYAFVWRPESMPDHALDRKTITAFLTLIVWFDFIAGHVLNNIRGLG
jgi:hypothetical protein